MVKRAPVVICPVCNNPSQAIGTEWGWKNMCCGLHSWGGKPLTDRETHRARQEAHVAFDTIWQRGLVSRTEAYQLLSEALGLSPEKTHMALMDKETARKVPEAALQIRQYIRTKDYEDRIKAGRSTHAVDPFNRRNGTAIEDSQRGRRKYRNLDAVRDDLQRFHAELVARANGQAGRDQTERG